MCRVWHVAHVSRVCPGARGTPGKGLDRLRNQENLYLDPWHTSIAKSCQKIGFLVVPNGTRVHVHVAHVTMNCWQPSTAASLYLHVLKAQIARSNNKPWRDLILGGTPYMNTNSFSNLQKISFINILTMLSRVSSTHVWVISIILSCCGSNCMSSSSQLNIVLN